jgi:hypothetical protein
MHFELLNKRFILRPLAADVKPRVQINKMRTRNNISRLRGANRQLINLLLSPPSRVQHFPHEIIHKSNPLNQDALSHPHPTLIHQQINRLLQSGHPHKPDGRQLIQVIPIL